MSSKVVTREYVLQAVAAFNRCTPEQLAENLRDVPTRNLAVLRDAARDYAQRGQVLPQDLDLVVTAVTREIQRRWD